MIVRYPELAARIGHVHDVLGAVPSSFDCWVPLWRIPTLPLLMECHHANALAIAEWLGSHPKVSRVYHPELASHPQHALAERQQSGHGGILSFELWDWRDAARSIIQGTDLFALDEGLGRVESVISDLLGMSHASQVGSAMWPTPGSVRLSVGIEHHEDLSADLDWALAA